MMPEPFPSKSISMGGYTFQLRGITAEDPYWATAYNEFEPDFQRFCQRLVLPDYVCLDVGANIGIKTLYLSRHCAQGRIVAVEAGATVAECLAANIAGNDAHNATALHAAVGDRNGTLFFEEASAWGHVASAGTAVQAVTLEEIARRYDLQRLDFIKIDVEGAELPILKSSLDLINRFESLVFVEFNALTLLVWGNTNPRAFIEWCTANFRYVFALNKSGVDGDLLTPVISTDQCGAILHRNLIDDGCVTDLVMSNAAHRFTPSSIFLERRLSESLASLSEARAELAAVRTELVAAKVRHDELTVSKDALAALSETQPTPAELFAVTTELSGARHELAVLHTERSHAEAQNAELMTSLARSSAVLQRTAEERDALLASTSWRLSAPLRWGRRFTRRPS